MATVRATLKMYLFFMVRSTDVKSAILNRIFSKIKFNFCHFNSYVGSLSD